MLLIIIILLLITSVYMALYQFKPRIFNSQETHLPSHLLEGEDEASGIEQGEYIKHLGKAWRPVTNKFKGIEKKFPFPFAALNRKLIKAGSPLGALEFILLNILSLTFIPTLSFIILAKRFSPDMVLIFSLLAGLLLPYMWLSKKIKKRQSSIRKDLPAIIDLLNLCVSGGMDFMLAVNAVVRDFKRCDLIFELEEVYRQTQMGKTRREAMKNLAWRLDMPEVHSFVRTLVQADRMGSPMAEALNLQAEEMRVRRFQHGESMALKAPIKLLFPLFAFILPVVLIIVGGPIILQFVRGSMNFGF